MQPYHKIDSIYKRDERGRILREFSRPEFEYLYYNEWVCTEKVDGTNIRIGWDPTTQKVRIGGRTDNAQIPSQLIDRLNEIAGDFGGAVLDGDGFDAECAITLYGEGYGAKIQKGGGNYNPTGTNFVLFDVLVGGWWLQRADVTGIAELLGLDIVPVVTIATLEEAERLVEAGFDSAWGDFKAEGVVCTPVVPLHARDGKRVITKIKTKDYEVGKADAVAEVVSLERRRPSTPEEDADVCPGEKRVLVAA